MDIERMTPSAVRELVGPIIEFHRDHDEAPVFFRYAYVLGKGSSQQERYDEAVAIFARKIEFMPEDARRDVEVCFGVWNGETRLPPQVREKLSALPRAVQLAHACIGAYIFRCYGDIHPYLEPGVPPNSRVVAAYPELRKAFTARDFLLPVGDVVKPGHAWVRYKDHDIHVHPCLRREFGGGVHTELLKKLWQQHATGLKVAVGIDHFRLCPAGELRQLVELDAWFGAPFSKSRIDDPNAVGATLHARTRDISTFDRAGLLTEFWWKHEDGLKTLTIEELPHPEAWAGSAVVICRFIHTIRDINEQRFIHLDAAVTVFDTAEYQDRYERAMNHHRPRVWSGRKPKLFRIDAQDGEQSKGIADDAWSDIIASYFRGNELVLEYFAGRTYNDIYKERYGHDHPAWATAE